MSPLPDGGGTATADTGALGIPVPEGEPGTLHTAASALVAISGAMDGVAADLRALHGSLTTWQGPASVSFVSANALQEQAAKAAATATDRAGAAVRRYATALEDSQRAVRSAAQDATHAKASLDGAERTAREQGEAASHARTRATAAQDQISRAGALGAPAPMAETEHRQATQDAHAAEAARSRATATAGHAREDLTRAQSTARKAVSTLDEAARTAAAALQSLAEGDLGKPAPVGDGTSIGPATPLAERPMWQDWLAAIGGTAFGLTSDGVTGGLGQAAGALSERSRTRVAGYTRAASTVAGHWRSTPGGGRTWVSPHVRSGGSVSAYTRANATSRAWLGAGKWVGRGGTVLSFLGAGAGQIADDMDDPTLTTTDRVGRATAATAVVGGASAAGGWGGAEVGAWAGGALGTALIPIPGVGTAVGAAAGAIIGGMAGSWLAGQAAGEFKEQIADAGEWAANGVVDVAHGVAEGASDAWDSATDAASKGLSAINPFD